MKIKMFKRDGYYDHQRMLPCLICAYYKLKERITKKDCSCKEFASGGGSE